MTKEELKKLYKENVHIFLKLTGFTYDALNKKYLAPTNFKEWNKVSTLDVSFMFFNEGDRRKCFEECEIYVLENHIEIILSESPFRIFRREDYDPEIPVSSQSGFYCILAPTCHDRTLKWDGDLIENLKNWIEEYEEKLYDNIQLFKNSIHEHKNEYMSFKEADTKIRQLGFGDRVMDKNIFVSNDYVWSKEIYKDEKSNCSIYANIYKKLLFDVAQIVEEDGYDIVIPETFRVTIGVHNNKTGDDIWLNKYLREGGLPIITGVSPLDNLPALLKPKILVSLLNLPTYGKDDRVNTIEEANEVVNKYIKRFQESFESEELSFENC